MGLKTQKLRNRAFGVICMSATGLALTQWQRPFTFGTLVAALSAAFALQNAGQSSALTKLLPVDD
jgi:hypothetical protein